MATPLDTLRQVSDRAVIQRWWDGLGKDLRAVATRFVWAGSTGGVPEALLPSLSGARLLRIHLEPGSQWDTFTTRLPADVRDYIIERSD